MSDPLKSETTDERAVIDAYKIALCDVTDANKELKAEIERLREQLAEVDAYIQGGLPDTDWSRVEREACLRHRARHPLSMFGLKETP